MSVSSWGKTLPFVDTPAERQSRAWRVIQQDPNRFRAGDDFHNWQNWIEELGRVELSVWDRQNPVQKMVGWIAALVKYLRFWRLPRKTIMLIVRIVNPWLSPANRQKLHNELVRRMPSRLGLKPYDPASPWSQMPELGWFEGLGFKLAAFAGGKKTVKNLFKLSGALTSIYYFATAVVFTTLESIDGEYSYGNTEEMQSQGVQSLKKFLTQNSRGKKLVDIVEVVFEKPIGESASQALAPLAALGVISPDTTPSTLDITPSQIVQKGGSALAQKAGSALAPVSSPATDPAQATSALAPVSSPAILPAQPEVITSPDTNVTPFLPPLDPSMNFTPISGNSLISWAPSAYM